MYVSGSVWLPSKLHVMCINPLRSTLGYVICAAYKPQTPYSLLALGCYPPNFTTLHRHRRTISTRTHPYTIAYVVLVHICACALSCVHAYIIFTRAHTRAHLPHSYQHASPIHSLHQLTLVSCTALMCGFTERSPLQAIYMYSMFS